MTDEELYNQWLFMNATISLSIVAFSFFDMPLVCHCSGHCLLPKAQRAARFYRLGAR